MTKNINARLKKLEKAGSQGGYPNVVEIAYCDLEGNLLEQWKLNSQGCFEITTMKGLEQDGQQNNQLTH